LSPFDAAFMVSNYPNYSKELLILAIEESKDSCLNGQVARIINSLSGIHPDIHITMNPQEYANELAIFYRNKNAPLSEYIARLEAEKIPKKIIDTMKEHYVL
jgi:hypothetical protein